MTKTFQKRKEDFTCEHCKADVVGNGYTNHCSACLWSKHVDINPGDRAATCGGMMKPVSYEQKGKEVILTHQCLLCQYQKRNKISKIDNLDALLQVSK